MTATCTGTEYRNAADAIARAAELNVYPPSDGRRMCATCDGIVFPKSDGSPSKHKIGSNLERIREYRPRVRRY